MNGKFLPNTIDIGKVHGGDARSDMIWISVDKLSLILHQHSRSLTEKRAWQTPCGIFLAIVTTLCTTGFKPAFGFSAETWQGFFMSAALVSLIWLARELFKLAKLKTIDNLVEEVKRQADGVAHGGPGE